MQFYKTAYCTGEVKTVFVPTFEEKTKYFVYGFVVHSVIFQFFNQTFFTELVQTM